MHLSENRWRLPRMAALGLLIGALAACGQSSATQAPTAAPTNPPAATIEATAAPADTAAAMAEPTSTVTIAPTTEPTAAPAATVAPTEETVLATITPIAVTFFTPAQQEGPYYPVEKPADRDNDLTVVQDAEGSPAGQVLEFGGRVFDAQGMPLVGVTLEIWQTDDNGIYLHPGDRNTEQRDRNFQFYGETVTSADGSYRFRTILPGEYEPRPRHIHLKLKRDSQELLTTQIYFRGDAALAPSGLTLDPGGEDEHLVMTVATGVDASGDPVLTGRHDIVLNISAS